MNNNEELTDSKRRRLNNKMYRCYVNKEIAEIFDKKLKSNNLKFSEWLRQEITKYINKN